MSLGCPACHSLVNPPGGKLWCERPDCPSRGAQVAVLPIAVGVTDHALLRYLERAYNIDVEAIRNGIAGVCLRGAQANARFVQWRNVRFVLEGADVVTTLPREWMAHLDSINERKKTAKAAVSAASPEVSPAP